MVPSERYFNGTSLSSRLCERYRRFWYHHWLLQICWFLLISPSSWQSKKRLLEPLSSVIILGPFSTAGQIDNFFFCTIHWNKRNHDSRYWVGNETLSISRGGGGGGGGGGGVCHMNLTGVLIVARNCRVWSCLRWSGRKGSVFTSKLVLLRVVCQEKST